MIHNNANNTASNIVSIESEMQRSYLDYAMSVIVSRALPDVRDGMKPVHRRILYAMYETSNFHDKPYRKSARIVGDVMGKYHPHGDSAIYSSLVRMAQPFSLREPLIDGQGNFGSMDGDSPAQMRYTEVRLAKISGTLLGDIEQNTVDFQDNYDGAEKEPQVLPARFPNLLVNGTSGIAVGMATNIPTHNLGEVLSACIAYVENPSITMDELLEHVPGPDFPTGGEIIGAARARTALTTGRGSVMMRAKTTIEQIANRQAIIVTEVPYQVNKAELVVAIEELSKNKVIEGISEIRDESNKLGVRLVIELKKDTQAEVILNQLFRHTALQSSFSVNMLALLKGRPQVLNLHDIISAFVDFRKEVVTRRTTFLLNRARDRAHVLIGLSLAVANIDDVIRVIKSSADPAQAKEILMNSAWDVSTVIALLSLVDDRRNLVKDGKCYFTEEQAKAILEMRLQRLTGLEKTKIESDLNGLAEEITEYLDILSSPSRLFGIIKGEFIAIKQQFGRPRRTEIVSNFQEMDDEDLIPKEDMVVTLTKSGYIKRTPLNIYRAQKRGGKGKSGISMHADDIVSDVIVTNTHISLLCFSDIGKVYKLKVYKIPVGSLQSQGRALVNILTLAPNEKINSIMPMPENDVDLDNLYMMFATKNGNARRNSVSDFAIVQNNGKIAIRMDEGDKLIGVAICAEEDHILLATRQGKAIRFPVSAIRVFKSRTSDGVRAIKLSKANDAVISLSVLKETETTIQKRDEYLKIPVETRMQIAKLNDKYLVEQKLKGLELQDLEVSEIVKLAHGEQFILAVTERGFGKRTSAYEYRITDRGGQGVLNVDTSQRNGCVLSTFPVEKEDEIILMTNSGTIIRTEVKDIRITGRNAKGVKIFDVHKEELITSVTRIVENISEEEALQGSLVPQQEVVLDTAINCE